jgi:hypothetical protein
LLAEQLRSSRTAPEAYRSTLTYAITIFLAGFLLFEAEPMVAKYILPWYGGSAAVWTTCLLFFQVLVLAGYSYAHVIGTRLAPASQARTHLAVIVSGAALMLFLAIISKSPILPGDAWKPLHSDFPIARILLTLSVSIGIPFFAISATAPLLQSWLARTNVDASPYRLYVWSNLGAMLALLSYPFVIEPRFALTTQANLWAGLYLLLIIGMARSALPLLSIESRNDSHAVAAVDTRQRSAIATRILWIALAACASLMLYGATGLMTHDIAPVPFLWILPLSLYMLSFVICFDSERWYRREIFHPMLAITIVASLVVTAHFEQIALSFNLSSDAREFLILLLQLSTSSALLFAVCMVCHGELYKLRPRTQDLTSYYLMVSAGGVVGGVFSAVLAPQIFRGYWEARLAVWSCLVLLTIVLVRDKRSWLHERRPLTAVLIAAAALVLPETMFLIPPSPQYNAVVAVVIIALGALALRSSQTAGVLRAGIATAASILIGIVVLGAIYSVGTFLTFRYTIFAIRDFYGVFRIETNVTEDPGKYRYFQLQSGAITHGLQFQDPTLRYLPTLYYARETGLGILLMNFPRTSTDNSDNSDNSNDPPSPRAIRIGVIGLGTGTIAAWGQTGDYIRFYELNPTIIKLATDPNGYFTYLSDSSAKVDVVEGDARISVENELREGHPQNFDVLVLDAFSADAIPMHLLTREAMRTWLAAITPDGVIAVHISNRFLNLNPVLAALAHNYNLHSGWIHHNADTEHADTPSDWVLLSRNNKVLSVPAIAQQLKPIDTNKSVLWTDNYSNLFSVLQ